MGTTHFYTSEKLVNNEINFLSCTIFIQNDKIEFKTYRKSGLNTITSNYQKSVMSKRYLKSNIFTSLHHSSYSSSTQELFLQDMPNIKEIFLRNGYPENIINEKFAIFLCSPEKPEQPEISMTFCINYTSPQIEYFLRILMNRIKAFIPTFHVRFAYKSLKFRNIFVKYSKPPYSKLETCFLCYKFKCTCNSCYVGRTKRVLRARAENHRTFSYAKKTYYHINRCPVYVKKTTSV